MCTLLTGTVVFFNTRFSYWFSNAIGIVKVLTLVFIAITGFVVLGGHTRVPDPHANFRNAFEGKATPYGLTNALVKIIFSYAGYENAFNVVNEVKVCLSIESKSTTSRRVVVGGANVMTCQNPIKQLRRNGFIALAIVTLLYIFANIAYFSAGKSDIVFISDCCHSNMTEQCQRKISLGPPRSPPVSSSQLSLDQAMPSRD